MEVKTGSSRQMTQTTTDESLEEMANAREPLADEEWLKRYNEEVKQNEESERMLQKKLDVDMDSW